MPSARLAQLERLLAADPHDPFVLYGLAQEHAKAGNIAEALSFFDRCIAADTDYLYAYYHKAKVLADADRAPEAIAVLRAGIPRATARQDSKALSELRALLDSLE